MERISEKTPAPEKIEGDFINVKIRLNEAIAACKNLEVYINKLYGKGN